MFTFGVADPDSARRQGPRDLLRCHPFFLFSQIERRFNLRSATICGQIRRAQVHQRVEKAGEGLSLAGATLSHFRILSKLGEVGMSDAFRL